jgi:cyclopropane-fatty-acyl-phospholipid synthase
MTDPKRTVLKLLRNHQGAPFTLVDWRGESTRIGDGPSCFTLHFKTRRSMARSLVHSSLGFGEAFASGDIVIDGDLEEVLVALYGIYMATAGQVTLWDRLKLAIEAQSLRTQKANIEHHYGRGNDFYRLFLDKRLQYSCGYFRTPEDSLDLAQEQKIAHTVAKLRLLPGQRLIDIGCGWGHLMFHAAETYGVECVGLTLCDNQASYIREEASRRKLPIEVRVMNYLEVPSHEQFDRVVSVGMMCHIGPKHIEQYFDTVKQLTAPGGVCLLHFISKMEESLSVDPFVSTHIFPGYWFNSVEGVTERSVRRGFHVLDLENLRRHYAMTAHHWRANFRRNYDEIRSVMQFDEVFMRAWEFYLASVVAGFTTGQMHLVQIVLSNGLCDDYPLTRHFLYHDPETMTSDAAQLA